MSGQKAIMSGFKIVPGVNCPWDFETWSSESWLIEREVLAFDSLLLFSWLGRSADPKSICSLA